MNSLDIESSNSLSFFDIGLQNQYLNQSNLRFERIEACLPVIILSLRQRYYLIYLDLSDDSILLVFSHLLRELKASDSSKGFFSVLTGELNL